MQNIRQFVTVMCLMFTMNAFAEITQTDDLNVILRAVKRSGKNTILILDVDDVLITPQDQILHSSDPESKSYLNKMNGALRAKYTEKEVQHFWSVIFASRQVDVVHPDTHRFIKESSKYVNKVFCLTTAGVGSFGIIDSLENWRISELSKLGFFFKSNDSNISSEDLDKYLTTKDPLCEPVYKDGILFACNINKSDVLNAYLMHKQDKPENIIFVDDSIKNIEILAKYCEKAGIKYHGFEYTAAKKHNKKFDPKIAEMQINTLVRDNKWLPDNEAQKILNN